MELMATKLYESRVRADAHAFQASVIADGTAPRACCTDHVERGDTTVVWDDTPTEANLAALVNEALLP